MNNKLITLMTIALLSLFTYSCTEDMVGDDVTTPGGNTGNNEVTGEIWDGAATTFTKVDGANPDNESSQDRLTDNVWITRGNNGGQIFNIKSESEADKNGSPAGTEWAQGTIDRVGSLTFRPFRAAVGNPQDVVGKDLVLHLISDDIYISVKFTEWSQSKGGGFAYERSTP